MLIIDRDRMKWWYRVTAGVFAFFALKATMFGVLTGGQYTVFGPPNSMIGDNNDFALAMNMALPMFALLASMEEGRKLRLFWKVSLLCGIVAVLLTYSRGGFLGLTATLLMLVWRSKKRIRAIAALVLLGAMIAILIPSKWTARMDTISTAAENDPSAEGRIEAWKVATNLAMSFPLTGGGFETFTPQVFAMYGDTQYGWHVAHSIYFEMLGEQGFVGLGIFLLLLGSVFRSAGKLAREFRNHQQANWISAYSSMVQMSLLAYAVSGMFLSRAYFDLYYQLVATVVILRALAERERREKAQEAAQLESGVVPV
jgi:putative inorganic carbon (HCO3(-)) transporter